MKLKCKWCNKILPKRNKKYCNNTCQGKLTRFKIFEKFEQTGILNAHSRTVRAYLLGKYGHSCFICNNEWWQEKPIPLVLDHINGNSDDNSKENLRLVCGNCDMQLPTYKNKNKGNGRHYRRQRYKDGKSY